MYVLTITNQKGGVAKTTTAQAIAAGLHRRGKRVLYVDTDPQRNSTDTLNPAEDKAGTYEALRDPAKAAECIVTAGNIDLMTADARLAADGILTGTGREYRLKEALETVSGHYDYCIIDTPPALGILTINALTAADGCLIPTTADIYGIQSVSDLTATLRDIRKYTNKDLKILGLLLTQYNGRTVLSRQAAESIRENSKAIGLKTYETYIRPCNAIKEAQASMQDIFTYAPRSNAAADYEALLKEILADIEGREKP